MSGALVFAAADQGTLPDCLALEARGVGVPGSHGTITIRQFLAGNHPQGMSFCERGLFAYPGILA